MKQQIMMINIAAKKNLPSTSIYAEIYTKSGKLGDRDAIILVPGGPGNDHSLYSSTEFSILQAFFQHVDVILFDPRGCGKSQKSPAEYCTLEHYIEDLESIREYFKLPAHQFIMFGQSYGSIAALGYAIKYSQKIKKLLLIGGAASGDFLRQARENLERIGTSAQKELAKKVWTATFNGTSKEVEDYYQIMGPLYSSTFKPDMPTPSITYNVKVLNLGFGKFLKEFDFRPFLSQVKCRTLILCGEDDWILDKRQSEIIHHGIIGSELIVYKDCSHMLWMDQWDRFLHDTSKFLSHKLN